MDRVLFQCFEQIADLKVGVLLGERFRETHAHAGRWAYHVGIFLMSLPYNASQVLPLRIDRNGESGSEVRLVKVGDM